MLTEIRKLCSFVINRCVDIRLLNVEHTIP